MSERAFGCCRVLLLVTAVVFAFTPGYANNITVSNVTIASQNNVDDYVMVQFDISWENSWRIESVTPNTWDAAWIFIKYRLTPTGQWLHATLNTADHTAPSGFTIDTPLDGTGVFLYRSTAGTGAFNVAGVQLRWNYGNDGLADNVQNVDVKVLAIEMVYIPEGAFAIGSDGTGANEYTLTTIDTADARVAPSGLGEFDGQAGGYPTGVTPPDTSAWPNGYSAFYIMKYEISQGQYADFLTLLTVEQSTNRFMNILADRQTIVSSPPDYAAGAPDRACNWLSWADGLAYADWAGLRLMTEMEFEKAARGTAAPVANEYAWGSTNRYATVYAITDDGTASATVDAADSTGNASYDATDGGINGPLRVGIFAASIVSPTREEAGASYYGVMELSGNLWERTVSLWNSVGRAFVPNHGNGALTLEGASDVTGWPAANGGAQRGGSWFNAADQMRISDRLLASDGGGNRGGSSGFRAVRSAP